MNPAEAILEKYRRRHLPIITAPAGSDAPDLPDFEGAAAEEILEWAFHEFGSEIVLASSMQDSVLIDLAWKVEPRVEVFFLDTGFHFYETIATAKAVRKRYNLNLVMLDPVDEPAVWSEEGYKACCAARKVAPMNNYLKDKKAWMSGLRRAESETRAHAKAVEWDAARGLVKINPIVEWSDRKVEQLHQAPRPYSEPAEAGGLRLNRLRPVHHPGERPRRALGGNSEGRVRHPPGTPCCGRPAGATCCQVVRRIPKRCPAGYSLSTARTAANRTSSPSTNPASITASPATGGSR